MNSTTTRKLLLAILSLPLLIISSEPIQVQALETATVSFKPPKRQPKPRGGTAGGGSRPLSATCLAKQQGKLTALSPGNNLGLTQLKNPNFFVYLPQTTAKVGEFSLFDEGMRGIYQVSFPVAKQAGLVRLSLPDTVPTLVKNKPYYWTFALVCNPSDRTEDLVVGGWVERADLDRNLKWQLISNKEFKRVSLLAEQGYWYDAVNSLFNIQQNESNYSQLNTMRRELLKSVDINLKITP